MKRNEFIQLFEELSKIGVKSKNIETEIIPDVTDAFDLISEKEFSIEIERAMTLRTEGIRTFQRHQIKFIVTK